MSHNNSDSASSMDVDETFDNTQETLSCSQINLSGPSGSERPRNLTDTYARQYEEVQRILQEGDTSAQSVHTITQLLKNSAPLCQEEKKVQESVFGSIVLQMCAQVSMKQALALDTNLQAFDVQALADGILNFSCDQATEMRDWNRLTDRTLKMFKRSPNLSYLYGSFKPTELPRKVRKERVPRQTKQAAEKKEPEKVTNVQAADEGNDKAVQHLKKVLKRQFRSNGGQPIGFFDCVLDPSSFHRTVENIFHLSFLMKNNFCQVKQENNEGLPYIHYLLPTQVNELQKEKKQQCILSISPEMWQTLCKAFEIKEPMVPPMQ